MSHSNLPLLKRTCPIALEEDRTSITRPDDSLISSPELRRFADAQKSTCFIHYPALVLSLFTLRSLIGTPDVHLLD